MDDMRASLALVQLEKLNKDIIKRTHMRNTYIEKLSGMDEILIPFQDFKAFSSNYIFPIVLKDSNYKRRKIKKFFLHDEIYSI